MNHTNMAYLIKSFFVILVLIYSSSCVDFEDCESKTATVTKISVSRCLTSNDCSITVDTCLDGDDYCQFKSGTDVTIEANFNSKTDSDIATVKVYGILGRIPAPLKISSNDACDYWNILIHVLSVIEIITI